MPDYDADFYGWANEQAALRRAGRLADADIADIAEEIESMGRSEKRELLLRLDDSPSRNATLDESMDAAYALAVLAAQRETGLDRSAFPPGNPYSPAQAPDESFYPE